MTEDPVKASTVVICRTTIKWPHKILLLKRSEHSNFLPGAHVFPGGSVEMADEALGQLLARDKFNFDRIARYFAVDNRIVALHLAAAIRETYEETLLPIIKFSEGGSVNDNYFREENYGAFSSALIPHLDAIWPISWWITPKGETRRFDTRFFLTLVEDSPQLDQVTDVSHGEGSDFRWISPASALNEYAAGNIFLAPPTRSILERMAKTSSLEEFLSYVDLPLKPVRPYFIDDGSGKKILILPGDPCHEEQDKPSMLMNTRYVFP